MGALIIVDVQNDFLPGGALAVNNGDQVIPYINDILTSYELVVATQDWHPADHKSFADNHISKKPGDIINLNGLEQILWPVHCVQESSGAAFSQALDTSKIEEVFVKGTDPEIDSYSGFFDNGKRKSTGLHAFLQSKEVKEVTIVGLAADYCVKYTALDAKSLGYEVQVHVHGTRAVNLHHGDFESAISDMKIAGIHII